MGGTLVNSRTGFQPVSPVGGSGRAEPAEHPGILTPSPADGVTRSPRRPVLRRSGFGVLRVILAGTLILATVLFVAWLVSWPRMAPPINEPPARAAMRGDRIPLIIRCREQPVEISPIPGLAHAVSDEQLVSVLCAALPMWHPPTVPSLLHELRLWGRDAVFTKQMLNYERTGRWSVETLLNDNACRERTVPIGGAFLLDSPYGVHVVLSGTVDAIETRAEGHYGQLLTVLAEAGVPAATSVTTSSARRGSVRDILQDAIMRFSWTEELEFIAPALARWLAPERTWSDQFGGHADFDRLVCTLLGRPLGKGACFGCHVPYAIVTILRVDEQHPVLSAEVRKRADEWLTSLSELLEQNQRSDGAWDERWAGDSEADSAWHDALLDRITATGHHLEWIAFAPTHARPADKNVRRAVQALRRDIDSLPPIESRSFKTLLPVSHAARALALLRGEDPYGFWKGYWDSHAIVRGSRGYQVPRGPK